MDFKKLKFMLIIFFILLVQTACKLDDPGSPNDEPGILDHSDLTIIKGFLTYGPNNYVSNKQILIDYGNTEKKIYTDENGFYKAMFEPGTKYCGKSLGLTLYAQKPGEYVFSQIYNGSLEVGSTITININFN